MHSCRFGWFELEAKPCDFIAQHQAALFQAAQGEVIERTGMPDLVDQAVEVGVFDLEFDQAPFGGVEVVIHHGGSVFPSGQSDYSFPP